MALHDGSLIFVTDGRSASLAALGNVAALASTLRVPLRAVHLYWTRTPDKPPTPPEQDAMLNHVQRAMPNSYRLSSITIAAPQRLIGAIRNLASPQMIERTRAVGDPNDRNATPHNLAGPFKGVLALRPAQRRPRDRFWSAIHYDRLLRAGPLPVLILPPKAELAAVRRVLFPADLALRSHRVFAETLALCRALDAELHLLHVFGPDRGPLTADEQAARDATRSPIELLRFDQERLAALAEQARDAGVPTLAKTAEGRAHSAILDYSAANNVDLIVMASHGSRSLEDIVRGSTTMRVVQHAAVPVLAVRA